MIKAINISGGYGNIVVKNVSLEVKKGEFLGILGPNGSGKSTLLKMLCGILEPMEGSILIDGKNIRDYSRKQLAKKMTMLPQLQRNNFSTTVREAISIGRYPHQSGFFSSWTDEDEKAVENAMIQTDVKKYEYVPMDFLSGGERQRVFIAQALAQCADLLILDEPTNHLDINHQKNLLDLIWKKVKQSSLTVISVFHDMNLASLYCDRLLLMEDGQVKEFGEPHEVLINNKIFDVYNARISTHAHPEQPKPQMTILPDIDQNETNVTVTLDQMKIKQNYIECTVKKPLKVLSSAVHNAGLGWYQTFINRTVEPTYNINNVKEEYVQFLFDEGYSPTNTVGMMTAVNIQDVVMKQYAATFGNIVIVVTAGIGNAIDVSQAYDRNLMPQINTINTWVFINGKLSDEAFVQLMMTSTEAKTKALQTEQVIDHFTNSIATGTPTDSLLIAATQQGKFFQYGGPITEVGKIVAKGVFEATVEAIRKYRKEGDLYERKEVEAIHKNR